MAPWRSLGAQASAFKLQGPSLRTPRPPASAEEPQDSCSITGTRSSAPALPVPLLGGSAALSRLGAQPSPIQRGALGPAVRTTTPPVQARSRPRIPFRLRHSLSLARCPLLALELIVPGTAGQLLQAPGWPPELRAIGRPRTLRPERPLLPTTCLPSHRGSRAPALPHPLGTFFSPLHFSPWGFPEVLSQDPCPDSRGAPPRRPSLPPVLRPSRGSVPGRQTHPKLRSPRAPGALCRAGAPSGFYTASAIS